MTIFKSFITSYWAIVVSLVIVGYAVVTIIKDKKSSPDDELSASDKLSIIAHVKSQIIYSTESVKDILTTEKQDGREAAKSKIELQIVKYIESNTWLTDSQKKFIESMKIPVFVDLIEAELIKIGALTASPTTTIAQDVKATPTVIEGLAPLPVSSTTVTNNLNVDKVYTPISTDVVPGSAPASDNVQSDVVGNKELATDTQEVGPNMTGDAQSSVTNTVVEVQTTTPDTK